MDTLKKKVLFLCTHNSARSQIAEGLLKNLYGDLYDVYSAGTEPGEVHPAAVLAMREIGIDISSYRSKSADEFAGMEFDFLVTLCDNARESCPYFPGNGRHIHQAFMDPSAVEGSPQKQFAVFRTVRDEIRAWIEKEFGEHD